MWTVARLLISNSFYACYTYILKPLCEAQSLSLRQETRKSAWNHYPVKILGSCLRPVFRALNSMLYRKNGLKGSMNLTNFFNFVEGLARSLKL